MACRGPAPEDRPRPAVSWLRGCGTPQPVPTNPTATTRLLWSTITVYVSKHQRSSSYTALPVVDTTNLILPHARSPAIAEAVSTPITFWPPRRLEYVSVNQFQLARERYADVITIDEVLLELGSRVELVPMDAQCNDASIALYSSLDQGQRLFRPHSFSNKPGVSERLEHVAEAMALLGGMVLDDHLRLKFPCGEGHVQACRRLFLDSVKLDMNDPIEPKPLSVDDRKTGDTILVHSNGSGEYTLSKENNEVDERNRVGVATLGLVKLGELEKCSGSENRIRFTCGVPHDELLALLLTRALDVRSAVREIDAFASRGVLSAPSAQSV